MTVVAMTSCKGSPGVTTLACLVAASWPVDRRPVVVECDPAGGDLTARYALSGGTGWTSLLAAVRRPGAETSLDDHLQQLPGGLDVLVGHVAESSASWSVDIQDRAERTVAACSPPVDLIVDLGRLPERGRDVSPWMARADRVCLVSGSDAASAMHVLARSESVVSWGRGRVGLVAVGRGAYRAREIERLSGIPVLGEIPYDPEAAAVVTDGVGSSRRLARSGLVAAARRLAGALASDGDLSGVVSDPPGGAPSMSGATDSGLAAVPDRAPTGGPVRTTGEEQ